MARQRPEDVDKEVNQQEDENYGEETISGSNPRPDSDDDLDEVRQDAFGDDVGGDDELNTAREIEEDEEDILEKPINNYEEEDNSPLEPEDELEKIEKKEGLSTDDPMSQVSDDDFADQEEDDEE